MRKRDTYMPTSKLFKKVNIKLIFISAFCVCLFAVFFIFGGSVSECAKESLVFCASTLAPSLFPLMCASAMLLQSPASRYLGRLVFPLCKRLFGLSKNGSYVFLIGNLCGFPIGAQSAYGLYCDDNISKDELECLIIFSSTPSSAFVISAIGLNIFRSKSVGICLYVSALLSCIISGMIYKWVNLGKSCYSENTYLSKKRCGFAHILCDSVRTSAQNMLYICGFVVFFNLLCSVAILFVTEFGLSPIFNVIISGLLELSSGAKAAGMLSFPASAFLCALFIGWSGICVHFQIFSVCKSVRISYVRFFLWRAIVAVTCAMICFVAFSLGFM